jgi:hypothetical protein
MIFNEIHFLELNFMNIAVFGNGKPCSLIESYQYLNVAVPSNMEQHQTVQYDISDNSDLVISVSVVTCHGM